tara:strand:- start:316 stop:777 length:462 start_codon:yes stop_codon:yes gene_type:complete
MIVSSAKHQRIVNVPKDYLWKRISDFKNIGTLLPPPIIDEVKCESNEIGSLRYLTLGKKQKYPGEIIERLEVKYNQSFFVYSIVDTSCLPVRNYIAAITLKDISNKKTEAAISSNWVDKSPSPEEMKKMFEALYELMFLNSETQYIEINKNES